MKGQHLGEISYVLCANMAVLISVDGSMTNHQSFSRPLIGYLEIKAPHLIPTSSKRSQWQDPKNLGRTMNGFTFRSTFPNLYRMPEVQTK